MNKIYIFFALILFVSCDRQESVKSLGENEYFIDDKLSSISLGEGNNFWIGSETGDLIYFKDNFSYAFDLKEDRIYKVLDERNSTGDTIFWIGIRNSGLQSWKKGIKGDLEKIDTYTIPYKGDKYSPYDFTLIGDDLFVGTSQGLFKLDKSAENKTLDLLYSSEEYLSKQNNNTFIIHNIFNYKDSLLFCSSQRGCLVYDVKNNDTKIYLEGEHAQHVSVYNDTIFVVTDKQLFLTDLNGSILNSIPTENSPRLYYQMQGIHYLVGSEELLLSQDLEDFVKIKLRRSIPTHCRNIILPDTINNYTYLLTENAVWRIPNNIDIFTSNKSIKAACNSGNKTYYLSRENELYVQTVGRPDARWIYTFSKDNIINKIEVIGDELFMCNTDNVLQKMTLSDNWVNNLIRYSPKEIYKSKAKVNTFAIKKIGTKLLTFVGTQEGLVTVDQNNYADTIPEMYGMYITSLFGHDYSGKIYVSTLNDGVFYISQENILKKIEKSEDEHFVRDIIATNDHSANLVMLTNQQIISQNPLDSIRVKGYQKLLYVNDSIFYALPELGIHKFGITNKNLINEGISFNDIRFGKNSTFVANGHIILGSAIGALDLTVDGNHAVWVEFENAQTINARSIVIITLVTFLIIGTLLFVIRKINNISRTQVRKQINEINKRIESVLLFADILKDNDKNKIEQIKGSVSSIVLNSKNVKFVKEDLDKYLLELNEFNLEIGLLIPQKLEYQIESIQEANLFESERLITESIDAKNSTNIDQIKKQIAKNENWLEESDKFKNALACDTFLIEDWLEIEDLNEGISEKLVKIKEKAKLIPLPDLFVTFNRYHKEIEHIHSSSASDKIDQYIESMTDLIKKLVEKDKFYTFLHEKLLSAVAISTPRDNIELLKKLKPVSDQIDVINMLAEIKKWTSTYKADYERLIKENEKLVNKKFDKDLLMYVTENTVSVVNSINASISNLYEKLLITDNYIIHEILKLNNTNGQHAKVLALLISDFKIKRTLIPGMLGIYGNLNPVISRLINDRIRANEISLKEHFIEEDNRTIFLLLILNLID